MNLLDEHFQYIDSLNPIEDRKIPEECCNYKYN